MGAFQAKNYMNLKPAGWVREDYHILQGTRGEYFHGELHISTRQHLFRTQVIWINCVISWALGFNSHCSSSQVLPVAIWKHQASQSKTGQLNSMNLSVITHEPIINWSPWEQCTYLDRLFVFMRLYWMHLYPCRTHIKSLRSALIFLKRTRANSKSIDCDEILGLSHI